MLWASLVAQMVKNLPAMQESWVWSLCGKGLLEKGMATHSSILAWKIPGTEEPDGLQSVGSQRWTWLSDFCYIAKWFSYTYLCVYIYIDTHTHTHTPKNWCFWTVVLEKTLESPLDCKEIQPAHPKGDQSWVFIGRTDVEAETPIFWLPDAKSWLIWKYPVAWRDWG